MGKAFPYRQIDRASLETTVFGPNDHQSWCLIRRCKVYTKKRRGFRRGASIGEESFVSFTGWVTSRRVVGKAFPHRQIDRAALETTVFGSNDHESLCLIRRCMVGAQTQQVSVVWCMGGCEGLNQLVSGPVPIARF